MCISRSVWIFAGLLGLVQTQVGTQPGTTRVDAYTAVVPVNILCRSDPIKGLTCAAEYPDICKEQWNFPNPCTALNLAMNKTKFVHPFDRTKFLMCGEMGKLYVVQCPQHEAYFERCGQCVGAIATATQTASCETPLVETYLVANPCTRETIIANKLFFPFPGDLNKFIHCDVWGKAWQRICTPGEVWSQYDVACVNPTLLNPCVRETTDVTFMYDHPCDPIKYLKCEIDGRAFEMTCPQGHTFVEANQRCEVNGKRQNTCGGYTFGFIIYRSTGTNGGQGQVNYANTGLGNIVSSAGTQGTAVGKIGVVAGTGTVLDGLLSKWFNGLSANSSNAGAGVATGSSADAGVATGSSAGAGFAIGSSAGLFVHTRPVELDPAQLREYLYSSIAYNEPCTRQNLAKGWLFFKRMGDPHSFLQCDMAGRMYIMPCSTNKKDWFDPYAMTCVDGPVHVDNIVH